MATQPTPSQGPQPDELQAHLNIRPSGSEGLESAAHESDARMVEHPPSRGRTRFVPLEEWNRPYREADALLDEKTKRKHPEVSLADEAFKQQYQDQWVAVAVTEVDNYDRVAKGRVFAMARDRRSLFRRIKALRKRYPQLIFSDEFIGQIKRTGFTIGFRIV